MEVQYQGMSAHALLRTMLSVAGAAILAGGSADSALAVDPVPVGAGADPGVSVDPSGTAFIAFNGPGTAPQELRFCKLPRGGAACGAPVELPLPGDGASSGSLVRPVVSVDGATVRVLSYRYGFTSGDFSRVLLFTSTDGGSTFGPGVRVGSLAPSGGAVAGPGNGISLVNRDSSTHAYQLVPTDGQSSVTASAGLSTQYTGGGSVGLVDAITPLVVMRDSTTAVFSVFHGGPYNDGASWSAPQPIGPAATDRLAGGPSGLFVMLATGGHLEVRRYTGTAFGAPTSIPGSESISLSGSDLTQDAAGRLAAVWHDASGTLRQSVSDDGVTWVTQTLSAFADLREERVAAAADHGGVVIFASGGGTGARLYALPLAAPSIGSPPAPPALPPAAPPPGPPGPVRPLSRAQFRLSAPSVPRGQRLTLDASDSVAGGAVASSYGWDLNADGKTDATCDGTTPTLVTRLPSAGASTVKLTVTDAGGSTSSALQPLNVTRTTRTATDLKVPVALSYRCRSPLTAPATEDITAQGGPPAGCVEQVSFGIIDAEGCFDAAPGAQDIPIPERNLIVPIFTTVNGESAPRVAARAVRYAVTDKAFDSRDPVVSRKPVRINGLDIAPQGSAVVVLIPSSYDLAGRQGKTGYLVSSNATISVGNVKLESGKIRIALPYGTRSAHVFDFDLKRDVPFLKDLPLTGGMEGNLVDQATLLPAHVMLPGVFTDPSTGKGLSAEVTLRTSNRDGIQLDGLEVRAPHVFLGGIALNDLFFRYRRADETYEGGGSVAFPPQGDSITGSIGFQRGSFKYLNLSYDAGPGSTGITIGPGVSILHLGGAFRLNPTELDADTVIGMGVSTGGGCPAVGVRAAVNQHFDPPPYTLDARGSVELNCIPLSRGFLHIDGNGYVSFGGSLDYDFAVFSLKAEVTAQYLDPHFQVDGNARACIGDLGCIGGEAVISDRGMGFCADFGFTHAGAGFFYPPLATLANPATAVAGILNNASIMFTSCNVGQYRTLPQIGARAAGAGSPRTFEVTDSAAPLIVGVKGGGAVPQVKLAGPGGRVIQAPVGGPLRTADAVAFHSDADDTEYFLVKAPAKGTWALEPLDGSPEITDVRLASALPDPKVRGTVSHRGRAYVLRYRLARQAGQTVRFVEKAPGGERVLGTAKGASGTLRFTPSDAGGTARSIVAQVELGGRPQGNVDVARFTASPAQLGRPGGVSVRRAGARVKVTWKPVAGAAGYLVSARVGDGRRLVVPVKAGKRSATISPVGKGDTIAVHVTALRKGGRPGTRSREIRLRGRRR